MSAWLGVVPRNHVKRGVSLGIAQIGHGKRAPLARLREGDWLVYYSPREDLRDGSPVRAFTAIGRVADDVLWQADEEGFMPWRRRVDYLAEARDVPIDPMRSMLDLTSGPNWGHQLRRGLVPLSERDLQAIRRAMTADA